MNNAGPILGSWELLWHKSRENSRMARNGRANLGWMEVNFKQASSWAPSAFLLINTNYTGKHVKEPSLLLCSGPDDLQLDGEEKQNNQVRHPGERLPCGLLGHCLLWWSSFLCLVKSLHEPQHSSCWYRTICIYINYTILPLVLNVSREHQQGDSYCIVDSLNSRQARFWFPYIHNTLYGIISKTQSDSNNLHHN